MNALEKLELEELRSQAGKPRKFQALDFIGVGFGSWFIYETVRRKDPSYISVAIGAMMIYIHSQRFFYAPQIKVGSQPNG